MTRRTALCALAGGLAARGESRFPVYSRCLPDYLRLLAKTAYERREAALASLTTADAVHARQQWARTTLWNLIGGEPDRTPLNVRVTGGFDRPGYHVEKLVYESRPGIEIPADLYIPTGSKGPLPGVLFHMGHSLNGKAYEPYQKCCQGLARLGYMVLAFDPFGQGERTYYKLGDADEEHSRLGRQMLLVGDTMTRLQLWDAIRSLDVLAARPEVDPKRLASTGQSGGGTLTMLLAAADDRLSCAVVSCGNTENFVCAGFDPPGSTDDAEQNFVPGATVGFDRWDLLYPLAPKPLLIIASERDAFGTYSPNYIRSGEEEFGKLKQVYGVLGKPEQLEWKTTGLPHALSQQLRVNTYNFFERWLRGSERVVAEPEVRPEPDDVLAAGAKAVRPAISVPRLAATAGTSALRAALQLQQSAGRLRRLAKDSAEGCEIETVDVESAHGVYVPAYVFAPRADATKRSLIFLLEPGGRTRQWREGGLCHQLAAKGHVVCAFDVRGIGDLTPEVGRGNAFYTKPHATDEAYAWASLMLGHPLLGQRVADILAILNRVAPEFGDGRKVVLAASGSMCIPALCATAFGPPELSTCLAGGLESWASLVQGDRYLEPFSNFLPGILKETDLPLIAESVKPRRLVRAEADALTLEALAAL